MWLLKFLVWMPLLFFYRLLRDWWYGQWKKLRPKVVFLVGWGTIAALILIMLNVAPELTESVLNLVFTIAVLVGLVYLTLYTLPGGGKRRKK